MFKRSLVLGLAALACLALPAPARATDPAMDQEAMMKEWARYSTPSEAHAHLQKLVGKWTATVRMWMDPSQPATESPGTCEFTSELGGRWIVQRFHGNMMGMPFEGLGMTGYDNFRQRYVGTWTDNITTAMMSMTGNFKEGTKELHMSGLMDEPMTGEKDKKFRSVEKWLSDDSFQFEMYDNIPGHGEVKVMEIVYTRAK